MSNMMEIRVPDIGDFSGVPVIEILVAEGDPVKADDSLLTLESDKATMEIPAPADGVIREIKVKLDDSVSEGDLVAILELSSAEEESVTPVAEPAKTEQASIETASVDAPAQSLPPVPVVQKPAENIARGAAALDPSRVPYASPSIRSFARELGVDLTAVTGSGSKGRIVRQDVAAFVKSIMSGPARTGSGGLDFDFPTLPDIDYSRYGEFEKQPLSRIRKLSAGHLHRNWVGIPHVTQHDEADITDMEIFRKANADEAVAQGFKLTPLVFLIKASVAALKKFPNFNSALDSDGESLVLKKYFNIGVAVDTSEGLVVPVIRNCETKGIMELAAELAEISARARDKKLKPQDIQGGCFSISSLGGIGGTAFTPIINAPEVAILGVSRSRIFPVWDGDSFQPRLMLPLSLSYDHRVIDGASAARFTRYLASRMEDLRRLTL